METNKKPIEQTIECKYKANEGIFSKAIRGLRIYTQTINAFALAVGMTAFVTNGGIKYEKQINGDYFATIKFGDFVQITDSKVMGRECKEIKYFGKTSCPNLPKLN